MESINVIFLSFFLYKLFKPCTLSKEGGVRMRVLINKIRKEKGITLRQLEQMTGISKSTLNLIENEKFSPKISQLEKIAIALDVKITDLFESKYK